MDFITWVCFNIIAALLGVGGIGYVSDCIRKGEYTRDAGQAFHGVYVSGFILLVMGLFMVVPLWWGKTLYMSETDWLILIAEYVLLFGLFVGQIYYTLHLYKKCKQGFYL